MSSTVRMERTMLADKVGKPLVLAPVVGTLLGLWRAGAAPPPPPSPSPLEEQLQAVQQQQQQRHAGGVATATPPISIPARRAGSGSGSGVGRGSGSGATPQQRMRGVLLGALARHWDGRTEKQLAFLRALDWKASLPAGQGLEQGVADFDELCEALADHRAAAAEDAAAGGADDEVPEDFLDPITTALMRDPVVLPDSQVTLDRATIERHLLTSSTDPFSRGTITMDDLRPNTELKQRIQDWLASRSRGNTPR